MRLDKLTIKSQEALQNAQALADRKMSLGVADSVKGGLGRRAPPLTSSSKRTEKKIPLPLKRVRKEIPPPGQAFKDRKKYNRKRAKEELKRTLKVRGG